MLTEHVVERNEQATAATSRRKRRKAPWSLLIAGVAIAAAVIYLVVVNTGSTAEYYMSIQQVQGCSACAGQSVRVAGFVGKGGVTRLDGGQTVSFTMTDSTREMSVVYSGVVPDAVRAGTQVVVEGHYAAGTFHASNLLAKCPSKFQSATPGATSGVVNGGQ